MENFPVQEQYQILARLGSGGMADVYLGIQRGVQSFRQLVVIKRIRPQFVEDLRARQMFIDEALTIASLHHPHIVGIHDLRQLDESLCIAMEYVDGENLTFLLGKLYQRKERMPLSIAAKIIIEACEGLHAAHTACTPEGDPLNLVHRDISPHNLMLDRNGYLKIIDFGIAKSRLQAEKTTPGTIKGKFSYLSPDHFQSDIDARSDIYALGLVFFEMLTGQKAVRSSELSLEQLMDVVLHRPLPPVSHINNQLPPDLDPIIARATAKDREQRYPSAEELANDIRSILLNHGGTATNSQVKRWFHENFKSCIKNRKALEARLLAEADEEDQLRLCDDISAVRSQSHPCSSTGNECKPIVQSTEFSQVVAAQQTRLFDQKSSQPIWMFAPVLFLVTIFSVWFAINQTGLKNSDQFIASNEIAALGPFRDEASHSGIQPPAHLEKTQLQHVDPTRTEQSNQPADIGVDATPVFIVIRVPSEHIKAKDPLNTEQEREVEKLKKSKEKEQRRKLDRARRSRLFQEAARKAEAERQAELRHRRESSKAEEHKQAEERRRAEERRKKAEEQRKKAEEQRKKDELKKAEDIARLAKAQETRYLSGDGGWSGQQAYRSGCLSCHGSSASKIAPTDMSDRLWGRFLRKNSAHDRHYKASQLSKLFSPKERRKIYAYLKVERKRIEDQKRNEGAGLPQ